MLCTQRLQWISAYERLRFFSQSARVPLYPIQYSLHQSLISKLVRNPRHRSHRINFLKEINLFVELFLGAPIPCEGILWDMADSIPYLDPTQFQELIVPPPPIMARIFERLWSPGIEAAPGGLPSKE
jgi:hypothetical protein